MAKSERAAANEQYRQKILDELMLYFGGEQGGKQYVRQVASNAFGFYFVNSNGDEETLKITVSVPTGSRDDGEGYDLDGEADSYAGKCAEKTAKATKAAEEKAKKIAADKAKRAARAEAKKGTK